MIRYVRDGKADVFEQSGCTYEPRHCEILFRRGEFGPKEPAHQRAWQNAEVAGEHADGADARRAREQHLEESPAIVGRPREIPRELTERLALCPLAAVRHEGAAELAPPRWHSHVD